MHPHRPPSFCHHYSLLYQLAFLYDLLAPPLLGRWWSKLARSGARVVGVDLLPQMLRRARAKGGFPLILASAHRLPFKGGSLDKVTLSLALHEMPAFMRQEVLREIYRVLRPGGLLVLGEMLPPHHLWQRLFVRVLEDPSLVVGMESLPQEMAQAGLPPQETESHWDGFFRILLAVK